MLMGEALPSKCPHLRAIATPLQDFKCNCSWSLQWAHPCRPTYFIYRWEFRLNTKHAPLRWTPLLQGCLGSPLLESLQPGSQASLSLPDLPLGFAGLLTELRSLWHGEFLLLLQEPFPSQSLTLENCNILLLKLSSLPCVTLRPEGRATLVQRGSPALSLSVWGLYILSQVAIVTRDGSSEYR